MYVWVCVYRYKYHKGQRLQIPLEQGLQAAVSFQLCVLGIECGSSTRLAYAFSHYKPFLQLKARLDYLFFFPETGSLCVVLAGLELAI